MYVSGWATAWCSWRWFVRWWVRVLVYTLSCMWRLQRRVRALTYPMAWRPRALLHVFHAVVCLSLFLRVALCAWVVFSPCHSHTPCLSHGFLVLCVRGIVAGVLFCWWWRGGSALSLVRCPRLPFVVWLRGVPCNVLGSASGVFSWRLPYVVLLFCFARWCWGAHKSPTLIACTLLSDLGHATFRFPVLAALLCYKKGGWRVGAVVLVAPHCIAGQDR